MQYSKSSQYILQNCIGEGNFAKVFKAIDKKSLTSYAIKIINENKAKSQPKVLELLQSEIHILETITNQNVIKLYDSFKEKGQYYLVMELCNSGDLEKYIKSKPTRCISEAEALGFFKQLLNGFKALHEIKAMHRDFKLPNVLIHDGVLKIADLGFSKQADLAKTALGTGLYMAPEIMKYQQYDNKVDIWSLGICLYEMLYGEPPFMAKTEGELLRKVELNMINFNFKGIIISEELQGLIKRMLTVDAKKRINWIEIYNHAILNEEMKPVGGKLTGSVVLSMKKKDLEKQHQNVLFQQNKGFYANKNNNQYDNEDTEKVVQQYINKNPVIPEEERKKESDEDEKYPKLNPKNPKNNKQEELPFEKIDYPMLPIKPSPNKGLDKRPSNVSPQNYNKSPQNFQKQPWESQEKYMPPPMPPKKQENYGYFDIKKEEPSPRNLKEHLPRNMLPDYDDKKIMEIMDQKKEALQLHEKIYLHWRNIISHHAKVLNDGFTINANDNSIFMYFILAKRIITFSKEFAFLLEKKKNYFKVADFFEDFTKTKPYEEMVVVFQEEKMMYETYFESLLDDIKGYQSQSNPLYEKLKGEFNNKINNNLESLFKEILIDFLFSGMNIVEAKKNEGKKGLEHAKIYLLHMIEMCDCFKFKEEFAFDAKEEDGFNFEKYENYLKGLNVDKLETVATEKINSLLTN